MSYISQNAYLHLHTNETDYVKGNLPCTYTLYPHKLYVSTIIAIERNKCSSATQHRDLLELLKIDRNCYHRHVCL